MKTKRAMQNRVNKICKYKDDLGLHKILIYEFQIRVLPNYIELERMVKELQSKMLMF